MVVPYAGCERSTRAPHPTWVRCSVPDSSGSAGSRFQRFLHQRADLTRPVPEKTHNGGGAHQPRQRERQKARLQRQLRGVQSSAQQRADDGANTANSHRPAQTSGADMRGVKLHGAGIGEDLRTDSAGPGHADQQVEHRQR